MSSPGASAAAAEPPDGAPPQTVDDAMGELSRRYGKALPRAGDFGPESLLGAMLALPITVQSNPPAPLLFKACATATLSLTPHLSGQLVVYATDGADVPVTPCS